MNRRAFLLSCALWLGSGALSLGARADEESRSDAARERWQKLSPEKREKLRQRYRELEKLPPEEQVRVRKKMERWNKLSPEQRKQTRGRYKRWRELPPEKREELRERWQSLSPEKRKELRKRRGGQGRQKSP